MSEQQPISDQPTAVGDAFEQPSRQPADDSTERDAWFGEAEELPPRPRRRVLAPLPLALLAALAIACGFIAGVLVEKGQESGSASAAGGGGAFASRLAAARGGTNPPLSGSSTGSGAAGAGSPRGARGIAGASGAAAGSSATVGQVAYADKGTLYVTTSEGNTVKVTAAPGASVTKTVKASIKAIHPGETVIVSGASGANGAVSASSIRIGSVAGGLGGGAALFGGSASTSTGSTSGNSSNGGGSGSGEVQLFGKG